MELINLNLSSQARKMTDLWNMDTEVVGRKLLWQLGFEWSCYLTFNIFVNERFSRKLYGTPVKRKLKHLLVEVSIGPGMLASVNWTLALVLL